MARDDYYVIVYKILSYLYACLKNSMAPDLDEISAESPKIDISRQYWNYIMLHLIDEELIEGAFRVDMGDTQGIKFAPNFNITPNGITYLEENTMIKKVERFMGNQLIKTASGLLGLKL